MLPRLQKGEEPGTAGAFPSRGVRRERDIDNGRCPNVTP